MHVGRTNSGKEHLKRMQTEFKGIPLAEPIRLNSKLREQPTKKKSIFDFARGSKGAEDYLKLMQKVMSLK
jgi:cellulose biosynthesis protein BcsQ